MEILDDAMIQVNKDYVYCNVDDEMVLLGLEDGIYYGLNPVGAFIWEKIKEPMTIQEVRDAILEEFDVGKEECEQDLMELLHELAEKGLIDIHPR